MTQVKSIVLLVTFFLGGCAHEETHNPVDTGDQATNSCSEIADSTFEPTSVEALFYAGEDPVWVLTAKDNDTWLYVENYPSFGGATGAETRTLDDIETNYATCGVCVLLKTGCQPHGDHAHCRRTYMPKAGSSVTFDELGYEVGTTWSGSLPTIQFLEVSIDKDTYETTSVSDGETITLDAWAFQAALEAG